MKKIMEVYLQVLLQYRVLKLKPQPRLILAIWDQYVDIQPFFW